MRALLFAVLPCCGLPASVTKADFPDRIAAVICDRTRECARGAYELNYFGKSDCRAHVSEEIGDLIADLDDAECTYDATQAGTALADTAEMTCERFFEAAYAEAITDIWSDCEAFLPAATLQR